MEKSTLSILQCLNFTFSSQEVLVKELHQLIGCVIFHWPKAHHERLCASSQECSPQSQLLIAATDQCQTSFTSTQRNQFTILQIQAESVDGIKTSIRQQDRRKIGRIQPAMTMSCQVNNRATRGLFDQPGNGRFILKIAAPFQQSSQCLRLFESALQMPMTRVAQNERPPSSRRLSVSKGCINLC